MSEAAQADYLVRFYLLALGSGLVERVYWWQLIARGYGLIAPDADHGLTRRPSFAALRTLARTLGGARFVAPVEGLPADCFAYRFETEGDEVVIAAWTRGKAQRVTLPGPITSILGQDGMRCESAQDGDILLMPSVQYVCSDVEPASKR